MSETKTLLVNGETRTVRAPDDMPLLWVLRDRARHDRHEVRLRHRAVRRVHGAPGRPAGPLLSLPVSAVGGRAVTTIEGDRRNDRPARTCRRPGSTWKSSSAATASRVRSCRRRRCSTTTPTRTTPTSMRRWRATSVAAAPMCAFARPSSRPRPLARRDESMNDPRRSSHLKGALAGGFVLSAFMYRRAAQRRSARRPATFAPNAFIRIDRPGRSTLVMPQVEMGQGVYTSLAMIVAEELDADWNRVRVEHAPPNEKLYSNPASASRPPAIPIPFARSGNRCARRARPRAPAGPGRGAKLESWRRQCRTPRTARSFTIASGRRSYGALIGGAAALTPPKDVPLKDPRDFRLIGRPLKRLDTPDKINGEPCTASTPRCPG